MLPATNTRTISRGIGLSIALVALLGVPAAVSAQDSDAEWLARCEDDWGDRDRYCEVRELELEPTGRLEVDGGENGGAVVRGWNREEIRVSARIQAHARSRDRAREIASQVRIRAEGGQLRAEGPGKRDCESWSVVYHVDAPREIDLTLRAQNGPVAAHGVRGDLDLETRNGPVALEDVGGDVRARTENGPIVVELTGSRWDGRGLDAETRNGPVKLAVPEGYSAEIEAGTENGPAASEFAVTVTLQGRLRSRMQITLGDGGPPIRVVTTNGPFTMSRP